MVRLPASTKRIAARIAPLALLVLGACSSQSAMSVEFLQFSGCPNSPALRARLDAATTGMSIAITAVDLESLPADDPRLRWGAPTVLVDGVDLLGQSPAAVPALSCRAFPDGLPSVEVLREAMAQHASP